LALSTSSAAWASSAYSGVLQYLSEHLVLILEGGELLFHL